VKLHKPPIIELSPPERQSLLKQVNENNLDDTGKATVLGTINFALNLQSQLNEAQLTIANLKKLFDCGGESLKKLLQNY
jgi:hypothetical protein